MQIEPEDLAAVANLDDQAAADALSAMTVTEATPGTMANERTIPTAFANPLDGERLLRKLDAIAAISPPEGATDADLTKSLAIRTIKRWMAPEVGGIDVGHAGVRALLDALPALFEEQGVTAAEMTALKGLGEVTRKKYTDVPLIGPHHVRELRGVA